MTKIKPLQLTVLLAVLLAGCASQAPAPVTERGRAGASSPAPVAAPVNTVGLYTVKKGDTLYSIALDHGQSHRDIAAWSSLENPNVIKVGQQLKVTPDNAPVAVSKPIRSGDVTETKPDNNTPTLKRDPKSGKQTYSDEAWAKAQPSDKTASDKPADTAKAGDKPADKANDKTTDKPVVAAADPSDWVWPTTGKVGKPFAEGSSKGIDIPAKAGQGVVAANAGTVTLVSNALRGYGNLVVIKHSDTLLSVYAHNSKILVREGQAVTKGQKIAEVGASDSDSPKLHFEIRRQGKPVDPLKFLPAR